jgi:chemotaxis receptor (MCP) glutamine deamidase CheD
MPQAVEVDTADFAAGGETITLESKGIGSCVVMCLYDESKK